LNEIDYLGLITVDQIIAGFEAACGAAAPDGLSTWCDSVKCAQAYVLTGAIIQLRNKLSQELSTIPPDFDRIQQIEEAISELSCILSNAYSD
jgi:hypothetical protein